MLLKSKTHSQATGLLPDMLQILQEQNQVTFLVTTIHSVVGITNMICQVGKKETILSNSEPLMVSSILLF